MEPIYRNNCPVCEGDRFNCRTSDWQGNFYKKCIGCGLVIQDPSIETHYEDNYWAGSVDPDGKARNMLRERDFKIKNWYGGIADFINSLPASKILDIGCGPGFLLSALEARHEKYGLEISNVCIEYVKANFPDIAVINSNLGQETFKESYFDVVVSYHVLEHMLYPMDLMRNIGRVLKVGGTLIVGTPNIECFSARRFKGNFRMLGKGHRTLFSERNLLRVMNENGFTVFRKEYPFFKTDYFSFKNLVGLLKTDKVSPPFYKNIMTFYGRKHA